MSTPWFNGPLLGFDTETTGVDPRHDRLVTAALVFRPASSDAPSRTQDTVSTWLGQSRRRYSRRCHGRARNYQRGG